MSTVLTRRPARLTARDRDRDATRAAARQERLFGEPAIEGRQAAAVVPATTSPAVQDESTAPAPAPAAAGDDALAVAASTLDEAITALWGGLLAGEAAPCPACGAAMEPRASAGAGMVGGRCGGCATTLA